MAEISDDAINQALASFNSMEPATKPAKKEISDEELQAMVQPEEAPRSFWKGVGTAISGTFKKAGKGLQIEAVEHDDEMESNLKAYYKSLGEAQRYGQADRASELQKLIDETQAKIERRNTAPEIAARVHELQGQIRAINEDISGARPQDMGFWKSSAFDAATSIGVMAPAVGLGFVSGGAGLPLTTIALQTYAGSYAENRSKGLSRETSARFATVDGLTESMTELLPASRLLKNTGVFKKFLESTIADIPGEQLANFVQNASAAVAELGDSPTDEQVKAALKKSAEESASQAGSVAASTVMAGGVMAGGVVAGQKLTTERRGRKKLQPEAPPDPEVKREKPRFKNIDELNAAMKAQTPPGSEHVDLSDLDELLKQEAEKPTQAKGEVVNFEPKKPTTAQLEKQYKQVQDQIKELENAWVMGDISGDQYETQRKGLTERLRAIEEEHKPLYLAEVNERGAQREQERNDRADENMRNVMKRQREEEIAARRQGMKDSAKPEAERAGVKDKKWRDILTALDDSGGFWTPAALHLVYQYSETYGEPSVELVDRAGKEVKRLNTIDEDALKPMSDEDLLALYNDSHRRQKTSEVAGPAPIQPRLTGDKMVDRGLQTRFMRELREWAGEMHPMKPKASVTSLPPKGARSLSPTDRMEPRQTPLIHQLKSLTLSVRPVYELLANRAKVVHENVKKSGLDRSSGTTVNARQLLERMRQEAKGGWKAVINKLLEFVPEDQMITFQYVEPGEGLVLPDGSKEGPTTAGMFISGQGTGRPAQIIVKVDEDFLRTSLPTRTIIHELWHAVTYDYLADNPDSAVTMRVKELYIEALHAMRVLIYEMRQAGMTQEQIEDTLGGWYDVVRDMETRQISVETKDNLYGLTNIYELLAEAGSNPIFMTALAKASPRARGAWTKIKQVFHEIVGLLADALGFNKADAGLLHQIFDALEEVATAQMMLPKKGKGGKARVQAPTSDRFKEWFKGSKVVDDQGKPRVMYHGTSSDKDFSTFKMSPRGMWFTASPEVAGTYAENNDMRSTRVDRSTMQFVHTNQADRIMPVFLSIKNPKRPSVEDLEAMKFAGGGKAAFASYRQAQRVLFEKYRREGHDGVDFGDGTWVAFSREQVKSATGNRGTYSNESGNILRNKASSTSPYSKERQLKTKASWQNAMKLLTSAADKVPGVAGLRKTVDSYMRQLKQTVAPETLGPKATQSAAVLSKWIVNQMRNDASFEHQSKARRDFWEKNTQHAKDFIKAFESGWKIKVPEFADIAQAYRDWNARILAADMKKGIVYDAQDNYLYHIFKEHDKLADYMQRKYGKKWGDPGFIKERAYDLYEEAIAEDFEPLFTNPEDIMLARQHSSEIAQMKVGALEELYEAGLAWKEKPKNVETVYWRSPNGESYYVHHEAASVLHNAWNTQSMWSREGMVGDAFRGAMYLKNRIVPIKLSLSLFHFLHVLTINNATGMLRATKGLLLGNVSPTKWLKEMGKAAMYTDLISSPRFGGRIRAIFRGEIPPDQILPHEALSIQYMIEGGMLPEQSHQYKSNAKIAFRNALLRMRGDKSFAGKGKAGVRAAYELPFAALDWMQHWMFEKWIPSIKTTSYLNEVKTALESDPTLVHDQQRRQIVFHRLAKSVDNRHGEMVYKTMFWNKAIKDLAVVNLLSLGWQMGFIREYGGAIGDLKSIATREGDIPTKIKAGLLDRPIFVAFYTAQALMYGGLLTWALTGDWPEEWKDYIYPRDGTENKDGSPGRVNTMFYPREFAAIAEHIKQDGVTTGLSRTVANKASGIFGLAAQAWTGVDDFGQEFRDPHGAPVERVAQTMDFVLSELTPISVGGLQREGTNPRSLAMNLTGFSKAPGYATRGAAEAAIRHEWQKYNAKAQTPFERALYSKDMKEVRDLFEKGEDAEMGMKLDEMADKHQLTPKDLREMRKRLMSTTTPEQTMFRSLTWQQQKRLLDKMTEEEREKYLPFSNRTHLRQKYVSPDEVE